MVVQHHAFLTSALDGGERSASRSGRFIPRDRFLNAHWIGGWMGPRICLTAEKRNISAPNFGTLCVDPPRLTEGGGTMDGSLNTEEHSTPLQDSHFLSR
jgi:hypothetical protein